jgi:hypothetical protein
MRFRAAVEAQLRQWQHVLLAEKAATEEIPLNRGKYVCVYGFDCVHYDDGRL